VLGLADTTIGVAFTSTSALVEANSTPFRLASTEWVPTRKADTFTVTADKLTHAAETTKLLPKRQAISGVFTKLLPYTVTIVLPPCATQLGFTPSTWISGTYANNELLVLKSLALVLTATCTTDSLADAGEVHLIAPVDNTDANTSVSPNRHNAGKSPEFSNPVPWTSTVTPPLNGPMLGFTPTTSAMLVYV
jgi:hypothetical protein